MHGWLLLAGLLAPFFLSLFIFKRLAFRAGLIFVMLSAGLGLAPPQFLEDFAEELDFGARDAFFRLRGPLKPSGEVVIVDIDNRSLQEAGQWPWPRSEVARAIRHIHADSPRAIGFDIVFAEPDRMSLGLWMQRFKQLGMLKEQSTRKVAAAAVNGMLLSEWQSRIASRDPNFSADANQQRMLERSLELDKQRWSKLEEQLPYRAPPDPATWFRNSARELFFLGGREGDAPLIFDNDVELGAAFAQAGVVAGGLLAFASSDGKASERALKEEALEESEGLVISRAIEGARSIMPALRRAYGQITNVDSIQVQTLFQGAFNLVPDRSGSARHYHMLFEAPAYQRTLVLKEEAADLEGAERFKPENYEEKIVSHLRTYPALALEILRRGRGYDSVTPQLVDGQPGLLLRQERGFPQVDTQFPELALPLDFKADLEINFLGFGGRWTPDARYGPDYYFPYVSMVDALDGRFEPGTFKDKYVIIGSTDPTLFDLLGSPFRAAFPGLEVHATVLDNMLSGRLLRPISIYPRLWRFAQTLCVGAALALVLAYASPWLAGGLTAFVLGAIPSLSYTLFAAAAISYPFVWLWFTVAGLCAIVILLNFFVEDRDHQFVTKQFSTMVSQEVLDKLRKNPAEAGLGGRKVDLSVMFSDVAGFTSISEGLKPERLVSLLNDYLTPLSDIIMQRRGYIDKYIGDAIMACWGVPYPDDKHALNACLACIEQQERLAKLRPELKQRYGFDISCRMGVATGRASAAMMGSDAKKNYTVMGDVVNLGARLEPTCKDYGVDIIICDRTYQAVKDDVEARLLDKIVVKGKTEPMLIYELLGRKGSVKDSERKRFENYENALRAHWERKWDAALDLLRAAMHDAPQDSPENALKARIKEYLQHPPPDGWTGEYWRTTK